MRLRTELRRSLPKGHSADYVNFRSKRGGNDSGRRGSLSTLTQKLLTAENAENSPRSPRNFSCIACGGRTLLERKTTKPLTNRDGRKENENRPKFLLCGLGVFGG